MSIFIFWAKPNTFKYIFFLIPFFFGGVQGSPPNPPLIPDLKNVAGNVLLFGNHLSFQKDFSEEKKNGHTCQVTKMV